MACVRHRVDPLLLQRLLELGDTVVNFCVSAVQLLNGNGVVFLRLFEVELKFLHLSFLLLLLVLLPVFDTFLLPFFHEAGIALQFVDLNSSQLLLTKSCGLLLGIEVVRGLLSLAFLLSDKFLDVLLHVDLLLGLVERGKSLLEEFMLNFVEFFHGLGDLLGGLVVTELPGLRQHGNVCWRVDLLEDHLHLVKQPQSDAAFALHDLVDGRGVKLDV